MYIIFAKPSILIQEVFAMEKRQSEKENRELSRESTLIQPDPDIDMSYPGMKQASTPEETKKMNNEKREL